MRNKLILLLFILPFLGFSQEITGVSPNEGEQGETLTLTITGNETHFTQATYTSVWLYQASATTIYPNDIEAVSDESMNVEFTFTNNNQPELYNLKVFNDLDGIMVLENGFELLPNPNPPVIESITPETAQIGEQISFDISCSNTHLQDGWSSVWFSQGSYTASYASEIDVNSDTQMTILMPVSNNFEPGYCDVNIYNYIDGQITLENAVLLTEDPTPPSLISVEPGEGLQGEEITLTITGQNTHFAEEYASVWLQQGSGTTIYAYQTTYYGNETLEANLILYQYNTPGLYDVVVSSDLDGELILPNAFEVIDAPDPEIVSIDPQEEFQDEVITFTVTGQNTKFEQAYNEIWFTQGSETVYIYDYDAPNDETLTFMHEFHQENPSGYYKLGIYNYHDGYMEMPDAFLLKAKSYFTASICDGETFELGGESFTEEGSYEVILDGQNGTDSLVILNLIVNPLPVVDLGPDTTIHSSILLDAGSGPYLYEWSTGDDEQTLLVDTTWGYGTHTVGVTVTHDSTLCSNYDDIEITLQDSTGIDAIEGFRDIDVYPNPTNGQVYIDFSEQRGLMEFGLYNLEGKRIMQYSKQVFPNSTETINIENIESGMYILQIKSAGNIYRKMIVLTK